MAEMFDSVTMLDLLSGPSPDKGETPGYTIDVASFEEYFGPRTESAERSTKRRETADPGKLRELLASCSLEDDEPARRMSCDPTLLGAAKPEADAQKRRNTLALQSVPEEGTSELEETKTLAEEVVSGRPSMAWSFDETRSTMQELRRQLQVERDVATDAEAERDKLATELAGVQHELAARIDLVKSLEEQRDAANARANAAEAKALRLELEAARALDSEVAANAAAGAQLVGSTAAAEHAVAQAHGDQVQAAELRETVEKLQQRIQALEKVKITRDFAARVRAVADDRDRLQEENDRLKGRKGGLQTRKENADPLNVRPSGGDECRQS